MSGPLDRTERLLGRPALDRLARGGVGALDLIDHDRVDETNLNRQLLALRSTLGRYKADVAAERVRDIRPEIAVTVHRVFFGPDTAERFDFAAYDYAVDAIDTVTGKLALAEAAFRAGTPLISAMGAGNKLDPGAFVVADIYETAVCPLARVMRRELKRWGIPRLKVVYSREPPRTPLSPGDEERPAPGSVSWVPGAAGLVLAGEVLRDLLGREHVPA